jgi:hypothetical protein
MDSIGDVEWLGELGLPYQAAMKDAEQLGITVDAYLAKVTDATTTFVKSGTVHDREEFYEFLEGAVNTTKGKFCLILGGKSVGKSLVLADFAKKVQNNNNIKIAVLLLDARTSPQSSLATLILKKYREFFNSNAETKEAFKQGSQRVSISVGGEK